jgi:hypothetical protein
VSNSSYSDSVLAGRNSVSNLYHLMIRLLGTTNGVGYLIGCKNWLVFSNEMEQEQ